MAFSESTRVRLRPVDTSDVDRAHEMLSDWQVVRFMLFPLYSREDTETFVHGAMNDTGSGAWRSVVRAIVDAESEDLAGLCGIVILRSSEEGEIWSLLHPRFWGRGLATEAAVGLLRLGFGELGLHRMWACCLPENPASTRVLEKLGMRREGLRKANLKIHGEWKDSYQYAILADEWDGGRPVRNPCAAVEENKSVVLEFVDRLINRADASVADELLAPNFVDHDAPPGQACGPEGVKATCEAVGRVLTGMRATVEDIIAEGDRVVARIRAEATHAGPFLGFPATGKRLEWSAIGIYRLAGGKIAERWGLPDTRSLMRQMSGD